MIAHPLSDGLQPASRIFGGPPQDDPGKRTTRTKHRGLTQLSQLKTNLAFCNSAKPRAKYDPYILLHAVSGFGRLEQPPAVHRKCEIAPGRFGNARPLAPIHSSPPKL